MQSVDPTGRAVTVTAAYGQLLPRQIWLFDGQRCYSATLQMYPDRRFLDLLNDAVKTGKPFMPLTQVEMQEIVSSWVDSRSPSLSFSAEHVLLASELGATPPYTSFRQEKHRVPVRLSLKSGILLTGNLHCAPAEQMTDVLNHNQAFLPVTEVSLVEGQLGGRREWTFLAVKRETIVEAVQL